MTVRYILYAEHQDCEVQVHFAGAAENEVFSTGVLNIKGSSSFPIIKVWWPVGEQIGLSTIRSNMQKKRSVLPLACLPI